MIRTAFAPIMDRYELQAIDGISEPDGAGWSVTVSHDLDYDEEYEAMGILPLIERCRARGMHVLCIQPPAPEAGTSATG